MYTVVVEDSQGRFETYSNLIGYYTQGVFLVLAWSNEEFLYINTNQIVNFIVEKTKENA